MRKLSRVAPAVLALGLALVGLGTALAQSTVPVPPPPAQLSARGVILAIDKAQRPPALTLRRGGAADLALKVLPSTRITRAGIGQATLDDLSVNDRATVTYTTSNEAGQITATPPLADYRTFIGAVKSASAAGLVVTTRKNNTDVPIGVSSGTQYKAPGIGNPSLADFKVGDQVVALAVIVKGSWVAVQVHRLPTRPVNVHRAGTVEAYTAGKSITLKTKKGESFTYPINAQTKIKMKKAASTVEVGAPVAVSARLDPAANQYIARDILVYRAKPGKPDKK